MNEEILLQCAKEISMGLKLIGSGICFMAVMRAIFNR